VNHYRADLAEIAKQQNLDFVDVSAILAHQYEKLGQDKTFGLYHDKEPVHMDTPGSFFAAYATVGGLKALPDAPVTKYLAYLGQFVLPLPSQPADIAAPDPTAMTTQPKPTPARQAVPAAPAAPATK